MGHGMLLTDRPHPNKRIVCNRKKQLFLIEEGGGAFKEIEPGIISFNRLRYAEGKEYPRGEKGSKL